MTFAAARALAHVPWPEPTQRLALADPALRAGLLANPHLSEASVAALAAHADLEELVTLLGARGGDLAGLGACLTRYAALRDGLGGRTPWDARIDEHTSYALLRAHDPATAAATADGLTTVLPTGTRTAEVLLALGGPWAAAAVAARTDPHHRLTWLTGPAGQALPDEDAWALLLTVPGHPAQPMETFQELVQLHATVLMQRPALAARAGGRSPYLLLAQECAQRASAAAADLDAARTRWRRRRARAALLRRARQVGRFHGVRGVNPWLLAAAAARPGWGPAQRRRLRGLLAQTGPRQALGLHATTLARALGAPQPGPASGAARRLTWSGLRAGALPAPATGVPAVTADTPVAAAGFGLAARPGQAEQGAAVLARALADPDPAVGLARWRVALALLPGFAGTLAELATAATAVAA